MMKADKILTKTLATIEVILVVSLLFYFFTAKSAPDGSWEHTYFMGSVLLICIFSLIPSFIKKKKTKRCHDCRVREGKLHKPGCDAEECPFCHKQLISCNCCYEKLGLNQHQDPVYSYGLNSEQEKKWSLILKEKGLIPYGQEIDFQTLKL